MEPKKNQYATEEQLVYAGWLDLGMKVGFLILLATFLLYVFGVFTPHIPLTDLPRYWTMPVKDYLEATQLHTGWSWLWLVGRGDFMNFIGIAFLSAVTIFCFARIVPILFRKGDKVYGTIAILEILVLVLAASGILVVGH